jgi:hypothetical protein
MTEKLAARPTDGATAKQETGSVHNEASVQEAGTLRHLNETQMTRRPSTFNRIDSRLLIYI